MSLQQQQADGTPDASYDDGLAHCHDWARDAACAGKSHPIVADAGCIATPSSVLHDDAHYATA